MEANESKPAHTPEPWHAYSFEVYNEIDQIIADCGYSEDYWEKDGCQANAARIVACVNYCKGATNEELEAGTLESDLNKANEKLSGITAQRDELLAALKEAKGYIQGMLGRKRSTFLDELDATIRKVEKGIEQ
jgi:hypothetical protein